MSEVKQCCLCGAVGHDSKDCGMRAEFEVWARSEGFDCRTGVSGKFYAEKVVARMWAAWQAARAQPAESNTMQLAEMVLSDCGISTAISERLQRRVAERIQRHIDGLLNAQPAGEARSKLEPVEGDVLPQIGEEVLIHLASADAWVPHRVVGYYAWGDLGGNESLHRVFVRVVDKDGYPNARLLRDVRRALLAKGV